MTLPTADDFRALAFVLTVQECPNLGLDKYAERLAQYAVHDRTLQALTQEDVHKITRSAQLDQDYARRLSSLINRFVREWMGER